MALILNEQPDKGAAIELIANLLANIATLWQIPNWTANNSVLLAEWVFQTYKYEPLETIFKCLQNPRVGDDKIYRLTPDVVTKWMSDTLDEAAATREAELKKYKAQFAEKLPDIDYDSFKKRLAEGTALRSDKPKHWKDDAGYLAFKNERMLKHIKDDKQDETTGK